jgi:hypothetical protein
MTSYAYYPQTFRLARMRTDTSVRLSGLIHEYEAA